MADEPNTPEVPTDTPPGPQATPPVDAGDATTPPAADASAETPATEDGEEGDQPAKPKNRGGFQKRIHEQTAKIRSLERQLAEVTAAKPADSGVADAEAPKRESYTNYEDFIEAKAEYAGRKGYAQAQHQRTLQANAEARDERMTKLKAELSADATEDPAFAKAWTKVTGNFPVSEAMGDYIAESDDPHAVIEWLAENFAEAERLSKLSDRGPVFRALARVEAKQAQAPPARTPQAPPPPPTVGGRSTPRVDLAKLASASNPDDYIAKRREQRAKAH